MSSVWNGYTILINEKKIQCKLCPKNYVYNEKDRATGNLWNHLKSKHIKRYNELKKNDETPSDVPSTSQQPAKVLKELINVQKYVYFRK